MSNDEGCYTLTLEASDANAPKNLEPIVLSTRVEVKSKQKSRYDVGSRGSSRTNSRATSITTG
uniref:SJCHGC06864 protein n=1 Tax=Schistosoma japonicum TaxID=6182 RepID=Q3KTI5_SCHJA|nr:SJCHGC06864 protein [Schistosoma japonicum]